MTVAEFEQFTPLYLKRITNVLKEYGHIKGIFYSSLQNRGGLEVDATGRITIDGGGAITGCCAQGACILVGFQDYWNSHEDESLHERKYKAHGHGDHVAREFARLFMEVYGVTLVAVNDSLPNEELHLIREAIEMLPAKHEGLAKFIQKVF